MRIDFSNVKENEFAPLPVGEYLLISDGAEVKETKNGTGEYINVKYKVLGPSNSGKFLFQMFNIKNDNKKATEIGLSQLKSYMKAAGIDTEQPLTSVHDLVGYKTTGVIKHKTDDYGTKAVISYHKPANAVKQNDTNVETDVAF